MSEKHTTDYSTTEKAESVQSVKAQTNPRQANQKHLGLKAFIISASVLGTVAGWGVLANNQIGTSVQSNSSVQLNASVLSAQNDASRWALPEVLAQNDIPPRVGEVHSNDSQPKQSRTTARQLPPPAAATDVSRVRSSAAKTAQNSSSDAPINVQPAVQPTVREVNVLPAPIQQRQPQAVARSRSSR